MSNPDSRRIGVTRPVMLLALVGAVATALYFFYQSREAIAFRQNQSATVDSLTAALVGYDRIAAADELLYQERYADAADAYETLSADTTLSPETRERLAERVTHARRVYRLGQTLDALQELPDRPRGIELTPIAPVAITPLAPPRIERTNPSQYDSLTFALDKAQLQVENLRAQLGAVQGRDYLAFKSAKGNDVFYVGEVRKGRANGEGYALLSTGSRYVGEWEDNRKHGTGKFYWKDGAYYEGEFVEDRREGQGSYHFPSGEYFVGEWSDDVRNGRGTFYGKKGKVIAKGVWEDDELVESL